MVLRVLADYSDRLVVLTDELIQLLHGLGIPDLDAVVLCTDGNHLACHSISSYVRNMAQVRADQHLKGRGLQVENRDGARLLRHDGNLIGVLRDVRSRDESASLDFGLQVAEVGAPESDDAVLRNGGDVLEALGRLHFGNLSIVDLDHLLNTPRGGVDEVEQAIGRSNVGETTAFVHWALEGDVHEVLASSRVVQGNGLAWQTAVLDLEQFYVLSATSYDLVWNH